MTHSTPAANSHQLLQTSHSPCFLRLPLANRLWIHLFCCSRDEPCTCINGRKMGNCGTAGQTDPKRQTSTAVFWRRGPESNRRIKVLQTSPLPLGYRALGSRDLNYLRSRFRGGTGWSGRRDLNPRPSPWQGDALPLSYSRLNYFLSISGRLKPVNVRLPSISQAQKTTP